MKELAILGIGNILQKDDGVAVYATKYLECNYSFKPPIDIVNGGVEGMNLLHIFINYKHIIILDAIEIEDTPGSIYHIPSDKLSAYRLNSGGAHEIGVLECFDILELMGKNLPKSSILGIVPETIDMEIGLSNILSEMFEHYIDTFIKILQKNEILVEKKISHIPLSEIINRFKNPSKGFL